MPDTVTLTAPQSAPGPQLRSAHAPAALETAVPFTDAESAARWLKSLPLTNVSQLTAALLHELQAMTAVDYTPRERATIAEVLREHVAHLHTELARRYAGKPQPPGEREAEAVEQAVGLWTALWEQYSACLKPLFDRDPELEGVKAKVLQRGLYVGKELVLAYGLARQSVPAAVWQEIHAYYRLAEILGCTGTAVSDELLPNAVGVSCYGTYVHALLLALGDPYALTVKQIELADRWLQMWSRKVFPYVEPRADESPTLLVDLAGESGATLVSSGAAGEGESLRFGYTGKLATSVRGRLKRLQSGADPAELQLGGDCSIEQCTLLLSHLLAKWYQPPRSTPASLEALVSLCGGGLHAAYYRVAGRTFSRTDPLAAAANKRLALETLGAVTDYDPGREQAEVQWAWEAWAGVCEAREALLTRTEGSQHRWFLHQLVVLRDGEHLRVGHVVRLEIRSDGALQLVVRLFAGRAKPLLGRPLTTTLAEDPLVPCLLLAESREDKACLLVPPRTFNPGRLLRSAQATPEKQYRLTRLIQRGADFERVEFEEAP